MPSQSERPQWTLSVCSTCKRQVDEMDGGWCHDHEPPAEFERVEVVAAAEHDRLIEAMDRSGYVLGADSELRPQLFFRRVKEAVPDAR